MTIPTLAELYIHYEKISDESTSPEDKEIAYRAFLSGTKGGDQEKRLACQSIVRFSKHFEALKDESFNCILDLCDDEDMAIRKQAAHDLLLFSKRNMSFVPRVADVFVQMLQTEDPSELQLISLSLSQLLHSDPKSTLTGIFNQLLSVNPENPREHVMRFLVERLKNVPDEKMTAEVEDLIVDQTNKVLHDVSEDEFPLAISVLSSLKCMSTLTGRQKLVTMITDQALQACPEFNKNVHARDLYFYLLSKVLPNIVQIPDSMESDRLALLRLVAELSSLHESDLSTIPTEEMDQHLNAAFKTLIEFVPELPQTESADSADVTVADGEKTVKPTIPTGLKLAEVECLLHLCCHLGRLKPAYFGAHTPVEGELDEAVQAGLERVRLVRPRLQYLSKVAQDYAQSLAGNLTVQNGSSDEEKTKLIAHRLVTNVQNLVRCFFHNPPVFKTTVVLSWLTLPVTAVSPGMKRTKPMDNNGAVPARREQPRYVPPIGHWSRNNQQQSRRGSGGGGGGGGRRNFRGRGRNW